MSRTSSATWSNGGVVAPHSSREMADWVVPASTANSAWLSPLRSLQRRTV
jgi:hypothetical protein